MEEITLEKFRDQFQAQAEEHVKRLTAFSDEFVELVKRHNNVRRDLERERVAGRHAQEDAERLEAKLKALEECTMRGAFVLVLVDADADAYTFDNKYYAGDLEGGGERAAVDLKAAVQRYLKTANPNLATLPVMTKAFASGTGLATLMCKAGIAKSADPHLELLRFTSGFSQADDMFDFILVGKGKDRADHKLMGVFRHFIESPSCRHILLACCHDNGYVRMLEKYVHNPDVVEKVTLVGSFQTGSEFAGLPFRSTRIGSVFRNSPFGTGGGPTLAAKVVTANGTHAPVSSSPPESPINATKKSSPPATYASRAASSPQTVVPPAPSPGPLPEFGSLDKSSILVNIDGHRIDMPLPPKSAAMVETFNRKIVVGKRYCNGYQLSGSCLGGCGYRHDQLTAGEKLVMRHKLRREKCLSWGRCKDPLCFYGHHCSLPGRGEEV